MLKNSVSPVKDSTFAPHPHSLLFSFPVFLFLPLKSMATLPRFFKIKTLRSLVTGHIPTSSAPPDGQLGETDLNPTQSSHVCVLSLFFTGLALLLLHPHPFAESRIRSTRAIRFISSSRNDPLRNHPSGDRKRARDFLPLDFPSRSSLQGVVRFSEAMEGGWSYEQKTLISELILGANLARQLRAQLSSASSAEKREVLIQGILNSYEKALFILKLSGPVMCQTQPVPGTTAGATGVPESPLSVNGSPCSNDFVDSRDISKKRKMLPKWTDQVKTSPETGLEGPHDDGYSWRKYGQKDILCAKYPRSYYRCTYRNTQNCWATKQVQRLDEDPTVFEITYRGKHTCALGGPSTPAPASPEKGEPKQINQGSSQQDQPQDPLTRFRTGLRVETENLDGSNISETPCTFSFPSSSSGFLHHEPYNTLGLASKGNHGGSLSSPFLSPSTPESNYFSVSQCPMNELGQTYNRDGCGSDLIDIISATNSCTNSPILDLDFSLDAVGIDPNFPFETAGYLP